MAKMMLIYSWLKFTDMPLFTMCVFACVQSLISDFSVQKDQAPVPRIDVSCVGHLTSP